MALRFEWDREKVRSNWTKHSVSFREAATVFGDSLSLTVPDPAHSETEERFVIAGLSSLGRLLVVVHVERGDVVRIISARRATSRERRTYEESES